MVAPMKHFIGGFAVGAMFALLFIKADKKATLMSNLEFSAYMAAHVIPAILFGLAAWGLIP